MEYPKLDSGRIIRSWDSYMILAQRKDNACDVHCPIFVFLGCLSFLSVAPEGQSYNLEDISWRASVVLWHWLQRLNTLTEMMSMPTLFPRVCDAARKKGGSDLKQKKLLKQKSEQPTNPDTKGCGS